MDTSFSSISALLSQFSTIASGSTGGSVILSYVAASGEAKTASFKAVSPVSSQNSSSSSTVFKLLDVKGIKSLLLYLFIFFWGGGGGRKGEIVQNLSLIPSGLLKFFECLLFENTLRKPQLKYHLSHADV